MSRSNTILIEGTQLIFRNLSGKPSDYNRNGSRVTGVVIPPEMVNDLVNDGWRVKELPPRDPADPPLYYMNVKCRFDNFPPKVYLVTQKKKTQLDEETIDQLDYSEIESVDIEISPYEYEITANNRGRAAYIKVMYVKVIEDAFAEKYNFGDVED